MIRTKADTFDDDAMNLRTVVLSTRERTLLLKYGYPWPEVAEQLRSSKAVNGYHHVPIDEYWIQMMQADLVRSAKDIRSSALLKELEGLCNVLDCALESRPRIQAVSM